MLDLESFGTSGSRWETQSADVTPRPHSRRLHVVGVDTVRVHQLGHVHVGMVRIRGRESMPSFNDGVKDLLEDLVALFIAGNNAHAQVRVVDASLDRLVERVSLGRLAVLEQVVPLLRQVLGHQTPVLGREVREVALARRVDQNVGRGRASSALVCASLNHNRGNRLLRDQVVDGLARNQLLLHRNEQLDAIDHGLNELGLGVADALLVRHIVDAAHRRRVLASRAAGLQVEQRANVLEAVDVLAELGQLDHDTGAQTRAEVGRARADEPVVVVVHELPALSLDAGLDVLNSAAEALEDGADVSAVLHADDAHVVLLIAPDEERLVVVVEDASRRRPVASGARSLQQRAPAGLLEEEVVRDELLLVLGRHAAERVELAREVSVHGRERALEQVHDVLAVRA